MEAATTEALRARLLAHAELHDGFLSQDAEQAQWAADLREVAGLTAQAAPAPQPAQQMFNGLTEAETSATASVAGLSIQSGMCSRCGKWAGAHATLPGQSRDHLCMCVPQAAPAPHVGDSDFEAWNSTYNPAGKGDKQRMRDAYAAGMSDPASQAAPAPQPLTEAQILEFAMHAADRIPASNYEGRVIHAVRMAERAHGITAKEPGHE